MDTRLGKHDGWKYSWPNLSPFEESRGTGMFIQKFSMTGHVIIRSKAQPHPSGGEIFWARSSVWVSTLPSFSHSR